MHQKPLRRPRPLSIALGAVLAMAALLGPSPAVATGGPTQISDIKPGSASTNITIAGGLNGLLYFWADDGVGIEVWKTDGTSMSAVPVTNVSPPGTFAEGGVAGG